MFYGLGNKFVDSRLDLEEAEREERKQRRYDALERERVWYESVARASAEARLQLNDAFEREKAWYESMERENARLNAQLVKIKMEADMLQSQRKF